MSNGLAVFATSLRRGHFLRPSIVLIMYFRRKCEGIFVVVPLNLQLYVLISPIWPADAEIKALETKRLKNWTNNCHERYCSSWIMCIKGFVYHLSQLGLLTETLTGTLLELKRLFTQDLTLSTGTVELPTIRQNSSQSLPQQTAEGTVPSSNNANNALDWNPPTMSEVRDTPITNNHGGINK